MFQRNMVPSSSMVKMKAVHSFETSVTTNPATQRCIPEDLNPQQYNYQDLICQKNDHTWSKKVNGQDDITNFVGTTLYYRSVHTQTKLAQKILAKYENTIF
jgi:CO dehydrogenase/acetyl-CoA synthase epsilon subunit